MSDRHVISLYDHTGLMVQPWADAGFPCFCYDAQHKGETTVGNVTFIEATFPQDLEKVVKRHGAMALIVFGFPPCTDLAASGTAHWGKKSKKNLAFQSDALQLVRVVENAGVELIVPWMIENPVGALPSLWRPADFTFDPCDFGGYLPEDDVHPLWPDYIAPRDAYIKKTCIWVGNYFRIPLKRGVPPDLIYQGDKTGSRQSLMIGGDTAKTKAIRSATPRGFATAVYRYNKIFAETME